MTYRYINISISNIIALLCLSLSLCLFLCLCTTVTEARVPNRVNPNYLLANFPIPPPVPVPVLIYSTLLKQNNLLGMILRSLNPSPPPQTPNNPNNPHTPSSSNPLVPPPLSSESLRLRALRLSCDSLFDSSLTWCTSLLFSPPFPPHPSPPNSTLIPPSSSVSKKFSNKVDTKVWIRWDQVEEEKKIPTIICHSDMEAEMEVRKRAMYNDCVYAGPFPFYCFFFVYGFLIVYILFNVSNNLGGLVGCCYRMWLNF